MKRLLLILCVIVSCGKKEHTIAPILSTTDSGIINKQSQNGDWVVKERITRDGDVYYKEESLPYDLIGPSVRKEYNNTQMSQVTVNPSFNTQLFRIEGKDTNNAVFVAPKLYAFSSSEVNRMSPLVDEDEGTITLFFPIMLIDGLSPIIPSPDNRHDSINVPVNMLVHDTDSLINFLNKKYSSFGEQNLARLSGCPKELIMTIAGRQFSIASDLLKISDYCDYNVPIYTSIKLPTKEALWLLQEGLYSGAAQIAAVFETRVPYTVSKFTVEMNKSKLYEEIAAKLSIKKLYAEVDLQMEIVKIVKQQAMKISIQGNMTDHLDSIVRQAIDQFFEKMPSDPTKADLSCGSPICLKLSYNKQTYEEIFSVDWVQTSNVLSGQNITTWARLFPLSDANVRFDTLESGEAKTTELILMKDDIVDLKVTKIILKNFTQVVRTNLVHNTVVVGSTSHVECSGIYSLPFELRSPIGQPGGGGVPHCITINTPTYEDHWVDETEYSAIDNSETMDNPIGKTDIITDSIYFGFSWYENGVLINKECPANSFVREGDGHSLLLRINNVPNCEVFTKNSTNKPKLYVINKDTNSINTFKEGKVSKYWNGTTTDTTKDVQHQINSNYSGEVSIRGYRIGNTLDSTFGADKAP